MDKIAEVGYISPHQRVRDSWKRNSPPRVQEFALFAEELLRPQKTAQATTTLINTLGSLDRALGSIDRAVARDRNAHNATDTYQNAEKRIGFWEKMGWRTVGTTPDGKPINEKFTAEDGARERENLPSLKINAKNTLLSFVHKHHGYLFNLLHNALGNNQAVAQELDDSAIREITLINQVKKRGLYPESSTARMDALYHLAYALINKSSRFHFLKPLVNNLQEPGKFFVDLHAAYVDSHLAQEVAETSEENRIFSFRQWLISTGQKALIGEQDPVTGERKPLKIYPTPYYEGLVRMAEFLGRKENGIAGSIYTGPPGTGKTRLGVLANQLEGFDTRVIQIHHYATFIDLIGERAVQVGLDKATSYQQRLIATKEWFNENPAQAIKALRDFYTAKRDKGEITERTFEEFMGNFVMGDTKEELDMQNTDKVASGFERYLNYQIAGASLGLETGSNIDEWVNGELLLAMSQGKRALLDELDKAGPYSLGGLLTLLSQSPGETFAVGGKTVDIPAWFRVDATANVVSLNRASSDQIEGKTKQYLYDRFNVIPVSYPPIKDDLMIAAVRLSDRAGNLKITEDEQWQILGVYAYMIPALRRIYEVNPDVAAVSHRLTADFCSFLVNPQTGERTQVSVEQALNMALSKIQNIGSDQAGSGEQTGLQAIRQVIDDYFSLYQKPSEISLQKPKPKFSLGPVSAKLVDSALAKVLRSPLMRAAANYQVEELPFTEEKEFQMVQLKPEQRAKIREATQTKSREGSDLGFDIVVDQTSGGYQFTLMGDNLPLLTTQVYQIEGKPQIQSLSADARTALITTQIRGMDKKHNAVAWFWGEYPSGFGLGLIPDMYTNIQLSADGKLVVANDAKGAIYLCSTNDVDKADNWYLLEGYKAKELSLSPDGHFLLIEDADGRRSRVFDLQRISGKWPNARVNADDFFEGTDYEFATPDLIVKRDSNQAVLISPKTDLNTWLEK